MTYTAGVVGVAAIVALGWGFVLWTRWRHSRSASLRPGRKPLGMEATDMSGVHAVNQRNAVLNRRNGAGGGGGWV
ncbi:MAG: hypothetical protein JKP97_08365 [Rhodobacteraceae bacterium]|jgi:hypothetical protein|nr:hypothetical protein [Paracoccaceae bacterium]